MKCMSLLRLIGPRSVKCMNLLGEQAMNCMSLLENIVIELSGHMHTIFVYMLTGACGRTVFMNPLKL